MIDLTRALKDDYEPSLRGLIVGTGGLFDSMPKPPPPTPGQIMQRKLNAFQRSLNPHLWDRDCDCW